MTRLVEQRRALPPGPVIGETCRFKDEQGSEVGLIDLFGDKDTLVGRPGHGLVSEIAVLMRIGVM